MTGVQTCALPISGHKAALFNCGLFEFQNKRNFAKAKDLISRSSKAKGGETGWDDRALQMLNNVQNEEAQAKQAAASKPDQKGKPQQPSQP